MYLLSVSLSATSQAQNPISEMACSSGLGLWWRLWQGRKPGSYSQWETFSKERRIPSSKHYKNCKETIHFLKKSPLALLSIVNTEEDFGFFLIYWSIVYLHCCVNSSCKLSDSVIHICMCIHMHIYTWIYIYSVLYTCVCVYTLFQILITGYWIQFPGLNSKSLQFIHFIHSSAYMLIPNS